MNQQVPSDRYRFCPWCAAPLASRVIDGEQRAACAEACGFVHWNNPVPVVAALVLHRGDAILVRKQEWPPTWYGLVTGFLEQQEEPQQAVAREVQEELSLQVLRQRWIGNYGFAEQNQVLLAYALECEGSIVLSEELSEYKRVPVPVLKPWAFGTGRAVADWLEQHGRAPR